MINTSSRNSVRTTQRMNHPTSRTYDSSLLLLLLIIIEILSQGVLLKLNPYIFSAVYLICGILIALIPLRVPRPQISTIQHLSIPRQYTMGMLVLITLLFVYYCKLNFAMTPIDYKTADMLPVIEVMCQRALTGAPIYSIIPEIWGGMQPIYLPAMWIPFIPAVYWGFDMRWITVLSIIIGILLLVRPLFFQKKNTLNSQLIWIPILLMIIDLSTTHQSTMTMTEEGIVIGWYAFLAYTVQKRNYLWIGIAVAMCLMSRYALAPWALMIGILLLTYQTRSALRYGASALVFISLTMWLSGALEQLEVFASLQSNYLNSIQSNPTKYDWMIHSSLGVAKYLPYVSLPILHRIFLIMSFGVPTACFGYYIMRRQSLPIQIFMICSLKLSLVFFFNLLIMPYAYLFYTSTIISIALWMIYTQSTKVTTPSE